ncbi:prephenate dehydratase [Lysinibacter sp. HNR]|uniref:prephenate dehydratase n=1 Tax=Lysinibacter sp. HNR TaxID=3031408 RepID=UPI0024350F21|nr:prephenate dehydratase [Lysinibacter sp. HNR]WGD37542.1 prephenate dehydratase [Lysinibacter sp. HNR]
MVNDTNLPEASRTYSYLGPSGTFTEAALAQVPEAQGQVWRSVNNVGEALQDVVTGRSTAAMIAIENSVEGGVSVTQDALATTPGLQIMGEYLVNVNFVLVARRGTTLDRVKIINAHPVAYGQCQRWINTHLPDHEHIPASSNVAAAATLFNGSIADAAIAPPAIVQHYDVELLAQNIGDNDRAVTRFILVGQRMPASEPTGSDKTSLIAELPEDEAGSLNSLLDNFSTRGVNLGLIQSRPIGDALGRYRFVLDIDGHIRDERVADALLGIKRFSPHVIFLGSYPRADGIVSSPGPRYSNEAFTDARDWLRDVIAGKPPAD